MTGSKEQRTIKEAKIFLAASTATKTELLSAMAELKDEFGDKFPDTLKEILKDFPRIQDDLDMLSSGFY
ncbi:MAG: hypothetical protein QM490_02580 [Candidatus Gracilibacteria bacterium]